LRIRVRHALEAESIAASARLQRIRFQGGAIPESDYRQAESQYRDAVARVPELEREIARQENFLSVLLGRNPGPIARGRDIDHLPFPAVPAGLPASLLERRPDIRQAEQQLVAANANIGVAKAAYFPDISLTGLLGLQSGQLSSLFSGAAGAWSFGAALLQPIFDGGRIAGQVAATEAQQREALHSYEKSIISAFRDVEDALVDRAKYEQVRSEQARNVDELRRFRDLAELRYREGATIYLEVANAEQSLLNAELALATAQSQYFQSYANLYKAMGGGWIEDAEALVPTGVADVKSVK
jgi:multidrug efflux system outer membrane protein